jgi:hypothetical protein
VCHQTVGLIARHAEANGIPTLSMSSARDITAAVNPPRATFLDWPLGHTSGRPHRPDLNERILRAALAAFERIDAPGTIVDLDEPWADDDDWKDRVMRPRPAGSGAGGIAMADDRVERWPTPQYQTADDAAAAAERHGGQDCVVCAGIDY